MSAADTADPEDDPSRPGARRPSTLQGLGEVESATTDAPKASPNTDTAVTTPPPPMEREMQVRSLAELAAESHLAVSSVREPLPAPAQTSDGQETPPSESQRRKTEPAKKKKKKKSAKPAPLTLGPAKRAAHNFDSIRRPTAGQEERVESASVRRSRRRKKPPKKSKATGGVIEEVGPAVRQPRSEPKQGDSKVPAVRERLKRLSDGELKKISSSPPAATASERLDETVPVDLEAHAPRREREDEKTRRHVYGDRELESAKPSGQSGPDHPAVRPKTASAGWQPGVVTPSSSHASHSKRPDEVQSVPVSLSSAPALHRDDDTPILSSPAPTRLPGSPASPSQPVPAASSAASRWVPVFLASALGAFIAVALYWTAFDAGASSRVAVVPTTPAPAPPPAPAAAPAPPPPVVEPEPEPEPEEPAPQEEEHGPLDLGDIPAPIAALSTLERQQLAQDLRIRARVLNRTHQYRRAEQVWRLSLQHDPANAAAAHGLAETLLSTERPEPAMEWARRATELETEDATHEELLGDALMALDELEGATVAYRRALELNPDSRGARIRLSRARRRLHAEP